MARLLTLIASLSAVPLLTLAALALAGVSAVRHPEPVPVALATSLILALPVLGFSTLLPSRRAGLLLGANLWPVLLLMGLPLYFPGERLAAIDTGMALLGGPMGADLPADQRRALAQAIDGFLVEPQAQQPSPSAQPLVEPPLPPSRLDAESEQVALPYEGQGHSLLIPVTLEGPGGRIVETDMLFDTGATYTTLDRRTLRQLGMAVPPDAPTITFQTANGDSTSALVVLDRIWLGGFEVVGATVAVCDSCTSGGTHAGLLGLNVSSRFLITLDTARREVILEPHSPLRDRLDVRPWLDLEGRGATWPDGRTEVTITARNLADRALSKASVEVRCQAERFELSMGPFAPGETLEVQASIPPPNDCDPFTIDLASGAW
jgi:predicted aspartyl protease